jgi:multidrug resistance protein, MATE family
MENLSYSYRDLLKIALPLMISNFFYTLISITDIAFMRELGVTEQASIGYIALIYLIFFMIGFSYTKGTQILIAQKDGEHSPKAVGIILDNTMVVLLSLAGLLFVVLSLFSEQILSFAIEDKAVLFASQEYLNIRKWGFFFSFVGSGMIAYYSGIGKTGVLATAIVTMSVSNIVLNYILIFGKLGFAALGIKGAAYASNIAEGISMLILLGGVFIKDRKELHQLFYFKKISMRVIGRISQLSSPLVAQTIISLGAWIVFFTLIEKMGSKELAISNIVKQLYTILGIPTFALASTTNTVIGNVVGQKKVQKIIPLLKRIIIMSSGFILIFSLPAFIFPKFFISSIAEASLVEASIRPFYVALLALQLYSFSTVLFNCIASIGSTIASLIVEIIVIVIYLAYLYLVFGVFQSDLAVVWTSEWVYWTSLALLSIAYLRFSSWKDQI